MLLIETGHGRHERTRTHMWTIFQNAANLFLVAGKRNVGSGITAGRKWSETEGDAMPFENEFGAVVFIQNEFTEWERNRFGIQPMNQTGPAAIVGTPCPGCSGEGVLTDDPQVLKCTMCGGIFTKRSEPITVEQALKFVAIHQPMKAEADLPGSFYFDLELSDGRMAGRRVHGFADRNTKRVVQWG